MAFWLVCLGILTYSCQNTSRYSSHCNCESTEQLQSYKNWQPAVKDATWYAKKRKDEKENDKKYDIRKTGKANPFICASADCG